MIWVEVTKEYCTRGSYQDPSFYPQPQVVLFQYLGRKKLVGDFNPFQETLLALDDFPSTSRCKNKNWLVVSTPLKNISQDGNLPQIGVKIKNIWNHHLGSFPDKPFAKPLELWFLLAPWEFAGPQKENRSSEKNRFKPSFFREKVQLPGVYVLKDLGMAPYSSLLWYARATFVFG